MQPTESLENKLYRLSPDQRNEVEDFVDFLLSRSGPFRPPIFSSCDPPPLPLKNAPPPLTMVEPVHVVEIPSSLPQVINGSNGPVSALERDIQTPATAVSSNANDMVSRDYMDYGQFEQFSPGTDTVKKIRQKMTRPDDNDKTRQILDWIE